MGPRLGRLTIYTHRIPEMVAFYSRFFGYAAEPVAGTKVVELTQASGGAAIRLHPAAKSQKMGQVLVKLVFDVDEVEAFCLAAKDKGLLFGKIHKGPGYAFANAKDPSGNSVCVSSAAFVERGQPLPQRRNDL